MHHPFDPEKSMPVGGCLTEPLLEKVMEGGERLSRPRSLEEIADFARKRIDRLPSEYKRFENPHIYKVGLSDRLDRARRKLVERRRKEKS